MIFRPIDVTGATWGGSTVQTDDTTSSVSVPVDLDETQDSMEDSSPLKEMLSAVGKFCLQCCCVCSDIFDVLVLVCL